MEKGCNDPGHLADGRTEEWLGRPGMRGLLTEADANRRCARLGQHTFLRVS
jgi:hypothetical protein